MPLDPSTGLWTTPGLNENPGPGGPGSAIGGLLGVMNAFRSKSLSDQADAMRQQAEMEAISKNAAAGGAIFDTPEGRAGASAFNISPETTTQITEESPNRRLRMALSDLTQKYQGAQIPSWEIENAYITQGMAPPTGLYGYMGREKTAETSGKRIENTQVQHMMAVGVAALKSSKAAGEDEAHQRQAAEDAMGPGLAMLPDDQRRAVEAALEKAKREATGGAAPLPSAKVAELGARAKAETARANYLEKIAGPTAEKLADQHNLTDLRADILRLHAQILRQQSGGQMTPAVRARLLTQVMALEQKKAARLNLAGFEMTPEAKAAGPQLDKDYQGAIDEIKALLNAKPGAAAAPATGASEPGGGWQEGDTVHYPDGTSSTLTGGTWSPRK